MKKLLCLLLAALMLLSTVACTNSGDSSSADTSTTAENAEDETNDDNAVSEEYQCDLPSDLNYKDEPINILYTIASGREDELFVEGSGVGSIEEAVFERNQVVESQLGVTLELIGESGDTAVSSKLATDVKGNVGSYDIIINGTYVSISSAISGYYTDLNSLDYINTSKHYWTQGYNALSTFTANDRQYLASGSLALSMFRLMFFTIYNQKVRENYQMEDLYDVVKRGDWTLDYQYSMITGMYDDSDGDGERSETDTYGFITGNIISMDPYMVAADVSMIIREDDNSLVFNADVTATLSDLVDAVQKLVNDEGTYVFESSEKDDVGKNYIAEAFANDKALMATIMFWNMEYNIESLSALSYGIAPIPKLSADQEYKSYVQDQVSAFSISAAIKPERQAMAAATLESLAYNSYNIIRPAYYTNTLSTKFMQSPESEDILGIIFDSLYFDFSQSCSGVVGGTALRDSLRPIMSGKSNNVASQVKAWSKSMPKQLNRVNKNLAKLAG